MNSFTGKDYVIILNVAYVTRILKQFITYFFLADLRGLFGGSAMSE